MINNIEKSLTPAQRVQAKLIWHFVAIGIINAFLASIALIDQFQTIGLKTILIVIASQAALAIADAVRKYYQAIGQPQKAGAVASVEAVVEQKLPQAPKPTALGSQLEQAAQAFIAPPAISVNGQEIDLSHVETQNTLPNIQIVKAQLQK